MGFGVGVFYSCTQLLQCVTAGYFGNKKNYSPHRGRQNFSHFYQVNIFEYLYYPAILRDRCIKIF